MSKRFTDTEIWKEDWFIALTVEYREFWQYLKDSCDHAGIWKPNITLFNKLYDHDVDPDKALILFNIKQERVIVLKNGRWFLSGFIPFQYGDSLNMESPMHRSILGLLELNEVSLTSIRGQVEVKHRVKDKDKDRVKEDPKKEEGVKGKKEKRFVRENPPSLDEIKSYCIERKNTVDAQAFHDKNTSIGWIDKNGHPYKDWKAVIRLWESWTKATTVLKPALTSVKRPIAIVMLEKIAAGDDNQKIFYDLVGTYSEKDIHEALRGAGRVKD